jgi:hypothetical protein
MDSRRAFCAAVLGTVAAAAAARRSGLAQSAAGQGQGQGWSDAGSLPDRGAPTGRIGAATRSARSAGGEITLDLVAPLRRVGLSSVEQPVLYYILSGKAVQPLRFTISARRQARPLANLELPRTQGPGLGTIRLRDHGIRLFPGQTCTWSVTLVLDPGAPSQDLVGSALIEHRPADPGLDAAAREASLERRIPALVRAEYWYDAFALAEQSQNRDRGAAFARLLQQAELRAVADPAFAVR